MTRVLVVEDSRTQAELARITLTEAGFEVVIELDPREALRRLDTVRPDLVVSDVLMPDMNGYELCREIKAREATRAIPVMLMTTLDDPAEILHALECGADSFAQKGRGLRDLPARIESLLSTRAARKEQRSAGATDVVFLGRKFSVRSEREQILDLLLSTFEDAVRTNRALGESMARLTTQHEALLRAERAKNEMSALLVHDLKSPAAGLLMLAKSRLKKTNLSEEEQRSWRMVRDTADVSRRMALNLLDISRSEEGRLKAQRSDVDVAELIEETRAIVESIAEDRRLKIEVQVEPEARSAHLDRSLISRLLLNLADNAVRHAPAGGKVLIEARRSQSGLELRVMNDGDPIPSSLREKIFERYARLDAAIEAGVDTGRGLGLSFCRIAAEVHGGTVFVEENARMPVCFVARLEDVAGDPAGSQT